jgi:anastral spindle 1
MNKAVEDAMRRNIMTCPPIQVQTKTSRKSEALNVANLMPSTSSENSVKMCLEKSSNKLTSLVKMERLKDLLDRINHQKKLLLNEIEKRDDIPGRDLDNIKDRIKTLETERAELQQEKESKSEKSKNIDLLEERENKIREREQRLEMRLKQLFKESQKQANDAQSTSTISENGETISVPPVEIIIKVPNGKTKVKKSIRCLDTLHKEPSKVYPKTPRKKLISTSSEEEKLKIVVDKRMKKVEQQTQTSPAVSVIAEPKKSILKKSPSVDSDGTSISTSYQSLPEKIHDTSNQKQSSIRKNHHKLNPVLMHYITRLLGMKTNMDRNQLNVQVSPVLTPGSSTINTSGNNDTNSDAPSFDEKRLQKLREFINENYSFLSEVNETLEENKLQDENEENISKVEGVWQEVLRKKKPVKTNVNEDLKKQVEQQINQQLSRPLIDHNKRPKTAVAGKRTPHMKENQPPVKSQVTDGDMLSMTKILESHMLNNFSEYTSNCQKRIAELAQMMEKVRREKLKLIENSLSSGDYAPFTEYKELAMHTKSQEIPTTSQSDMKDSQREDPPSEEINNILHKQTKPFGVSKDSGISLLSRPVTSSDFRDSPDVRVTSEEPENSFQPILKDIPKPPKSRSTTDNSMETADTSKDGSKKTKPPLSLNRISPLLDKPHEAHELSTIAEVETPTASRVNIQDDERIKTFINFEEYERILKEKSSLQADPKLDELMRNLEELKIKTFVGPQAYNIEEISNQSRSNSNASSLVDVLDELKKRNLYTKHVENNQSTPPSQPQSTQPDSPKRPQPTSKISSGNTETVKDDQTTPKQHHRQVTIKPHKLTSPDANDLRRFSSSSSEGNLNKMEISSSDGRPMNLADFLAKELVKRPTNRSFSDESSLSSHFMRSLLNAGSARSMSSLSSTSNDEKVRTSTPVRTKSNPSGNSMFQGDSVSTLKGSDGDRSESSNDDKQKS